MISFAHRDMRRKTSEIFNERRWEGKIINCNNNCENILSFFSGHTKSLFLLLLLLFDRLRFRTDTRRFSSLGFHQSTNENMCADAFSSPEKVLLLRSSRLRIAKKKDYKVEQESFGRSFRGNIFRILLYFWRGFPIRCCFSCQEISTPAATASGKKARSDFDDFSPEYKQHSRKAFSMKISSVTRRNQNSF